MRYILLIIAVICSFVLGQSNSATCRNDACGNQIFGSGITGQVRVARRADCRSFFSITVTPAARTVTVTKYATVAQKTATVQTRSTTITRTVRTVTDTIKTTVTAARVVGRELLEDEQQLEDRAVAAPAITNRPTKLPSYAKACNTARYSSACSCLGVSLTTITRATPVVTTTRTITKAPTVKVTATRTVTNSRTASAKVTQTNTVPFPRPEAMPRCDGSGIRGTDEGSCECCWEIQDRPAPDLSKPPLDRMEASDPEGCIKHCDGLEKCQSFAYVRHEGIKAMGGSCYLYATVSPPLGFTTTAVPMGRKTSQECRKPACKLPTEEPNNGSQCQSGVSRGEKSCGCCYASPKKSRRPASDVKKLFQRDDIQNERDCANLCDANPACRNFFFHVGEGKQCLGYAQLSPRLLEEGPEDATRVLRTEETCNDSDCETFGRGLEELPPLPQCENNGIRGTEEDSCECCWEIKKSPAPDYSQPSLQEKPALDAEGCIEHCDALEECQTFVWVKGSPLGGTCYLYRTAYPALSFTLETSFLGRKTSQQCRKQECRLPNETSNPPKCKSGIPRGSEKCACCYESLKRTREPVASERKLFTKENTNDAEECAKHCDANKNCLSFFYLTDTGDCLGYAKSNPTLLEEGIETTLRGVRSEESCTESVCDVLAQPSPLGECADSGIRGTEEDSCECCWEIKSEPAPDFSIDNLGVQYTSSAEGCIKHCDALEDCQSFFWGTDQACFLYPTANPSRGFSTQTLSMGRKTSQDCRKSACDLPAEEPEPENPPRCDSNISRGDGTCGCCYATPEKSRQPASNVEPLFQQTTNTEIDCARACDANPNCRSFFTSPGKCRGYAQLNPTLVENGPEDATKGLRSQESCKQSNCAHLGEDGTLPLPQCQNQNMRRDDENCGCCYQELEDFFSKEIDPVEEALFTAPNSDKAQCRKLCDAEKSCRSFFLLPFSGNECRGYAIKNPRLYQGPRHLQKGIRTPESCMQSDCEVSSGEEAQLPQCADSGIRGTDTNGCQCCWEIKDSPQPDLTQRFLSIRRSPDPQGCIEHCEAHEGCQSFSFNDRNGDCFLFAEANPVLWFPIRGLPENMPMGRKTSQECRRSQCNVRADPPTNPPRCESSMSRRDGSCRCCYSKPKKSRRPDFEEATIFKRNYPDARVCALACEHEDDCLSFFYISGTSECLGYAKQYPQLLEHSSYTALHAIRTTESCLYSSCNVNSEEEAPTELPVCKEDYHERGSDCGCCYATRAIGHTPDPGARLAMPAFTVDKFRDCRAACDEQKTCRSFAWHTLTDECRLYLSPFIRQTPDGTSGSWQGGVRTEDSCTKSECNPPEHPVCQNSSPRRSGKCECCYAGTNTDSTAAAELGVLFGPTLGWENCLEQCDDRPSCKRMFFDRSTSDCYFHDSLDAELTEPVEYRYTVFTKTGQDCVDSSCTLLESP